MKKTPVPCHVIAGPLGVGKTTAILECIRRRADRERTAVVVNDFGETGIDQTILNDNGKSAAVEVTPIVGGCLCCTGPMYLRQALADLARRPEVDRIIIEPSGVAMLKALKQDLQRIAETEPITLFPFITMIPPARITEGHYQALPFVAQLIDEADYLVANKADCASEDQLQHFHSWTSRLHPAKKGVLVTQFGQLPDELFDRPDGPAGAHGPVRAHELTDAHDHDHDHHDHDHHDHDSGHDHDHQVRGHWAAAADTVIEPGPLCTYLERALVQDEHDGLLRCKGVIRTSDGWQLLQWTEEGLMLGPFAPQSSSRLEWIATGQAASDRLRQVLPA